MALLFLEGFDHYNDSNPATLGKWGSTGGTVVSTAVLVRTGTRSLRVFNDGGTWAISKAFPASGGVIVGVAINGNAHGWPSTSLNAVEIREGTTVHLGLSINPSGQVILRRGTTLIATGTTVLATSGWYYLELKATIHDTAGSYEVRIDGAAEAALTASGVDTRNGGATGQWDRIALWGVSLFLYFDDLYLCDTSGATHNTFLGVCKVETLLPGTGNGSNVGLTPSTGTDHGALVDENPPNTTDYNSSATVGLKDTYQYPSLSLTGTILGIQTNLYVAKSDAAARQVCAVVRSGGTDYDGANVSPTTTFGYFSEVRPTDPNTGLAWTSGGITSLEAGMKVTA